ncbi:uncharacterized protein MONBRDRAFT_34529 [Monosiga brevicollis MX1]|uniref:THO complex subunit 2 n=1 Tax=Monosiga brevicollis TaxID=81824 RepID=A9VCC0_MONBE|nr:uncharacterized protein MONBRDRAFT_34529 [Monosiga brevicollis MX1]EDQ84834.1 predicted protein [Monosiga brevicollis MX1]|eukprot:XP_001750335.1 hypothetical protein [Monosiga brevicollis MX1]
MAQDQALELVKQLKGLNLSPESITLQLDRLHERQAAERKAEREREREERQAEREREREERQAEREREREERQAEREREEQDKRIKAYEYLEDHFELPQNSNLFEHVASMSAEKLSLIRFVTRMLFCTNPTPDAQAHHGHTWNEREEQQAEREREERQAAERQAAERQAAERQAAERQAAERKAEREREEQDKRIKAGTLGTKKASSSNAEAYLPSKSPSQTPKISDINDNAAAVFGIVELPPSCHYLALGIVQRAAKLLSAHDQLPEKGIHTEFTAAYQEFSQVHNDLQHEPYYSTRISLALHSFFDFVRLTHQASVGANSMHADWIGFDSDLHPVVMGECKRNFKHFGNFGGQVGNQVVRLGIQPTTNHITQERQHLFYPLININVCGNILTAYLVLHLTRQKTVALVEKMTGLKKDYHLAFLRLGSARISSNPKDQQAVWALLSACNDFVSGPLRAIIKEYRDTKKTQFASEPFPCPAPDMVGWTCNETYGPNVQQYEHVSGGSWVIKHYDYWGRHAEAFGTKAYQIASRDARLPPSLELLKALEQLPKTGEFYRAWVVKKLATEVVLLRYPRVETAPCGLHAPLQLSDVTAQVQALHNIGFVHGDILSRNILFCDNWQPEDWMFQSPSWEEGQHSSGARSGASPKSRVSSAEAASVKEAVQTEKATAKQPMAFLIDFDLGGFLHENATYAPSFNCYDDLEMYRHPNARPNFKLQKLHDGYALARVAEEMLEDNDARKKLVEALEAVKLDEAIELCKACTGRQGVNMVTKASGSPPRDTAGGPARPTPRSRRSNPLLSDSQQTRRHLTPVQEDTARRETCVSEVDRTTGELAVVVCRLEALRTFADQQDDVGLVLNLRRLLAAVVRGTIAQPAALSCLQFEHDEHFAVVLADTLHALDHEAAKGDPRARFYKLLTAVAALSDQQRELLYERLEAPTLEDAKLVRDYRKILVRMRTTRFYKQQKYNLLHEENEGFAKLVELLGNETSLTQPTPTILKQITSLIGYFELDPNRVLDVILDMFEQTRSPELLNVIRDYAALGSSLASLVGFKFQNYAAAETKTPKSLFEMTAVLMKQGLLTIEDIEPHLSPTAENTEAMARLMSEGKTTDAEGRDLAEQAAQNQFLGLCSALIAANNWVAAKTILDMLPPSFAATQADLRQVLLDVVHVKIEPLYRKLSAVPQLMRLSPTLAAKHKRYSYVTPCDSFGTFVADVFPMLHQIGFYVGQDILLFTKVLRLCETFLSAASEMDSTSSNLQDEIEQLMDTVLLPALTVMPSNAPLSDQVYKVLQYLPYVTRFRLYSKWKRSTLKSHAQLRGVAENAVKESKYILKRLSSETAKKFGKRLGKLSHSCPIPVIDALLAQLQSYENLIEVVVTAIKYMDALGFDVMILCILEALTAPGKTAIKPGESHLALWLQNLSRFTGALLKRYDIKMLPILQYVANKLKVNETFDLIILKDLIMAIASIESVEDMTEDQLEAMSGGPTLRAEGGSFISTRQTRDRRKAVARLRAALKDDSMAIPLLILMGQQRESLVFHSDESLHLKLLGDTYDQLQQTLIQFHDFVEVHLGDAYLAEKLPELPKLCSTYKLEPDVGLFLQRSAIRHRISAEMAALESPTKEDYLKACERTLAPVCQDVKLLHPETLWRTIQPHFYMTFWSLSLPDLLLPSKSYDQAIAKSKESIAEVEASNQSGAKKRREIHHYEEVIAKLGAEKQRQTQHVEFVQHRLETEKDTWIPETGTRISWITQYMQTCVFPRCFFSAIDAIYCAKFAEMLHNMGTPHCTYNEAHRYGRFLRETLKLLDKWHGSKVEFERQQSGFASQGHRAIITYEDFRSLCYKWHCKLTKALIMLLEADAKDADILQRALVVLTKLMPYFPRLRVIGQGLEKRIKALADSEETRSDVRVMARACLGQLRAIKDTLVAEGDFHTKTSRTKKEPDTAKNSPKRVASDSGAGLPAAKRNATEPAKHVKSEPKAGGTDKDGANAAKEGPAAPPATKGEAAKGEEAKEVKESRSSRHERRARGSSKPRKDSATSETNKDSEGGNEARDVKRPKLEERLSGGSNNNAGNGNNGSGGRGGRGSRNGDGGNARARTPEGPSLPRGGNGNAEEGRRASDRGRGGRGGDRADHRGGDRDHRGGDRADHRGGDRGNDRGGDRGGSDRGGDRGGERGGDRRGGGRRRK